MVAPVRGSACLGAGLGHSSALMLGRVLLFSALAVFVVRMFFPQKWREFGRRFDRAINVILIGLAVIYTVQLVWWFSSGR